MWFVLNEIEITTEYVHINHERESNDTIYSTCHISKDVDEFKVAWKMKDGFVKEGIKHKMKIGMIQSENTLPFMPSDFLNLYHNRSTPYRCKRTMDWASLLKSRTLRYTKIFLTRSGTHQWDPVQTGKRIKIWKIHEIKTQSLLHLLSFLPNHESFFSA